jgi:hypothetical protein
MIGSTRIIARELNSRTWHQNVPLGIRLSRLLCASINLPAFCETCAGIERIGVRTGCRPASTAPGQNSYLNQTLKH